MATQTIITQPPILDTTGQQIVAALHGLKDADPTLSLPGHPADANITGKRFKRNEAKMRSIQTILQNILGGALDSLVEVTSPDQMIDHGRIYKYIGAQDGTRHLFYDHWYWFDGEANMWQDGGTWKQSPIDWDVSSFRVTVNGEKAVFHSVSV